MNEFKVIAPDAIGGNFIEKIGNQWMLLAAENGGRVNMMTASWGGVGFLWNRPVAFTFFRPQRFTLEFVNAADTMSMTFFNESYRDKLNFCGAKSGRDFDKVKECGFEVLRDENTPYFAEAELALICKKLYVRQLEPEFFVDQGINSAHYPKNDHHYMFVSEIVKAFQK